MIFTRFHFKEKKQHWLLNLLKTLVKNVCSFQHILQTTQRQKVTELKFAFVAFEFLMVNLSSSDPSIITVHAVSKLLYNSQV